MMKRLPLYGLLFLCISISLLPRDTSSRTLSEDEQLIAVGIGAFNDGLYEIAEKNLSDFVKGYPQHKKFYDVSYLLGRTYLMNGKWREARTSFSRILQDNKFENLDFALFWLGEIETRLGRLEEGRKTFATLVQKFPKFERVDEAYYALGLLDLANGQWTTGESFFKKASQVSQNQTLIQSSTFWLGVSSFKRNDYGTAISLFSTPCEPLSPPYPFGGPEVCLDLAWRRSGQAEPICRGEIKLSDFSQSIQERSSPLRNLLEDGSLRVSYGEHS